MGPTAVGLIAQASNRPLRQRTVAKMAANEDDSHLTFTQDSLAEEIYIPSTPPPVSSKSAKSISRSEPYTSPPPSGQNGQNQSTLGPSSRLGDFLPASPPPTVRPSVIRTLPSREYITKATLEELRLTSQDLVLALGEARMSAAHYQLQYNLLSIESQESAQRAEVEHQMTRREVEVLQAAEHRNRTSKPAIPRTSPSTQTQLQNLTRMCVDLEAERLKLERRLNRAKDLLESESDRADLLFEENLRLKTRIRENREHYSRLKSQSPFPATPRNEFSTPSRRTAPRFPDSTRSHAPFAALLAADQVLNGEVASVPSTPSKVHDSKASRGHTRGAHSLSSLQSTPARSRTTIADTPFYSVPPAPYSAPATQAHIDPDEADRNARDSTISITDNEEAITDEDIPQSQASSLATNMLRRNPGSQENSFTVAERSSNLLQAKLFGAVQKAGIDRSVGQGKRKASVGDVDVTATKKKKLNEGIGLGIGV